MQTSDAYVEPDREDLALLGESVAEVLAADAGSLAVHAYVDGKAPLDRTLWTRAAELGWCGVGLPERFGGLGMGARGLDVIFQRHGAYAAPGPILPTLCAAQALAGSTDGGEIDGVLTRVAAGEVRIAIPATFDPDEEGAEPAPLFLGDVDSDFFLAPSGSGAWALLRVAPDAVERLDMWDRTRTVVRFDAAEAETVVRIDAGARLGERLALQVALALAADSLGGARALLAQTIAFMKERRQFDRPIASFQALKHRVADMQTMVEAGGPAIEQALSALASGTDAALWCNLAKARLVEDYAFIAQECLQLHGGVGFTWEYDVHLFLKRARLSETLLAPGWTLRDRAASALADAARAGRSTLELPLL